MARGIIRDFDRPPWWALLTMCLLVVGIAVAMPAALHRGSVRAADQAPLPAPTASAPVAVFLGDSYTFGLGSESKRGYVPAVAKALGWSGVSIGVSGSGFTTPGPGAGGTTFIQRLPQVIAREPRIVVVQGGTNDTSPDTGAAATLLFTELRSKLPSATIVAVGPTDPPGKDDRTIRQASAAIKQAAAGQGISFIDPIAEKWITDPASYADGIHPNDAGYAIYAQRLTADLSSIVGKVQ